MKGITVAREAELKDKDAQLYKLSGEWREIKTKLEAAESLVSDMTNAKSALEQDVQEKQEALAVSDLEYLCVDIAHTCYR